MGGRGIILAVLLAVHAAAADFTIERDGSLYTLDATNARLSDILAEIDRREPASLRFLGMPEGIVSARYLWVTLDELLYRLGVSYVLVYEPDDEGAYRLDDAIMLGSDADHLDPETRTRLIGLVRDLRDDDIPFNAHLAVGKLHDAGCEAVPVLQKALYDHDYQGRHLSAQILRYICPDRTPSDRLLEVTLELLKRGEYDEGQYWSLFGPSDAYRYLKDRPELYYRIRSRLLSNLYSRDGQERLLSALLAAHRGETGHAEILVRIMAPHLADNDLKNDAAAVSYALRQLGPPALPYLEPYRRSKDQQQAELAELIYQTIRNGEPPPFNPVMYVGYNRNPVADDPWIDADGWTQDRFPDEFGVYHNLREQRYTVQDYYGPYEPEPDAADDSGDAVSDLFPYTVKTGDTWEMIALKFSAKLETLIELNPGVYPNEPLPGTKILIPW